MHLVLFTNIYKQLLNSYYLTFAETIISHFSPFSHTTAFVIMIPDWKKMAAETPWIMEDILRAKLQD
jgi:hypothetical protein